MSILNQVRKAYLNFYAGKNHHVVPSASLVPENDPTTLFTGSGMQPMVPYLLGQKHPLGARIANSQRCLRIGDIEEVGDLRHTTFFEMLGNWSLGDYFKEEQLTWLFSFLTEVLALEPRRLMVSVYAGNTELRIARDDDAAVIWQKLFASKGIEASISEHPEKEGVGNNRVFYYGEAHNWWSRAGAPRNMPVGEPGGPDSEVFWDFGDQGQHAASAWRDQLCHPACDCGRFLEIGNSVFMQYAKTADGFTSLPQKNIDFGGGLERLAAAVRDTPDVFLLDVFEPARSELMRLSGKRYEHTPEDTRAFRVILDHIRAATFLIADGVLPSNKDQGYFVRRLTRRAIRFGAKLNIRQDFCASIAQSFIEYYRETYPVVRQQAKTITEALTGEEEKFRATLAAGLKIFASATQPLSAGATIPSDVVFNLWQSYGFPQELTVELAQEKGLRIDHTAFQEYFARHQEVSRHSLAAKFQGGLADHSEQSIQYHTATHLLHQALRTVLGADAVQKGSNITPQRLRFDFAFPRKLTVDERARVEQIVNEKIQANIPVERREMSLNEARSAGALGLFGEKYGERVSVYRIGDFSLEMCGGPHVERTGVLGVFAIVKEEAVSAGVRRIRAVLRPLDIAYTGNHSS
jgi:alanyl-tRNA synthetase